MIVNTITEAKAHFSALIEKVLEGEEVIIKKAGKPVAVMNRYEGPKAERVPGELKGKIRIADDFDDLPADMADIFGLESR